MIGIQLDGDWGAVAVWRESRAEVIGTGSSIAELVAIAKTQREDCDVGIIGVRAWYNDEQRKQIQTKAKEADISDIKLLNEPSASVFAYGVAQAGLPGTSMVLHVSRSRAFDVTVLTRNGNRFEILGTNGLAEIENSAPDQFFAVIEPAVNQAISDAQVAPQSLDAIIITGCVEPLRSIATQIEANWELAPVEPPDAETAIAYGAAVYGGFLESRQSCAT